MIFNPIYPSPLSGPHNGDVKSNPLDTSDTSAITVRCSALSSLFQGIYRSELFRGGGAESLEIKLSDMAVQHCLKVVRVIGMCHLFRLFHIHEIR